MRLVLDTNTLVSAIGWKGPPAQILQALIEGGHTLVTSTDLLAELTRVLRYARLEPLRTHPMLPAVLAWLFRAEHVVIPGERITLIAEDPADNLVLEAAVSGRAEVTVTGDRHLLRLAEYRGIRILSPGQFVKQFR